MNANTIIQKKREEKMPTILTKFMVVSLPRTGTKSLLQMAKRMGLEISHAPNFKYEKLLKCVDIMADTPVFKPSIISYMVKTEPNMKFIYITKTAGAWVKSMMKVGLCDNYNRMYEQFVNDPNSLTVNNIVDLDSLKEILIEEFHESSAVLAFEKHAQSVKRLIPPDRLLTYSFSDGWQPLADFLGREAPDEEVPHLNQETMFDAIID